MSLEEIEQKEKEIMDDIKAIEEALNDPITKNNYHRIIELNEELKIDKIYLYQLQIMKKNLQNNDSRGGR